MRVRWLLLLVAVTAVGCSKAVNPNPPAPLPAQESELGVRTLWSTQEGVGADKQQVDLEPAFADGVLYVADRRGRVAAVAAATGKELWSRDTGLPISGAVGIGDGLVLLGTTRAEVVALNAKNGSERWRGQVSSEVLSPPQAGGGMVVAQTVDGKVFAFDATDGKQKWFYQQRVPVLSLRGTAVPVIDGDRVYAGFADGKLAALALADGRSVWEATIAAPRGSSEIERMVDVDARPRLVGDMLFVTSYQGRLTAIARDSGVLIWARDFSSYRPPAFADGRLYVTDEHSHVWALNADNGATLWKQTKLENRDLTAPVVDGDYVVVGDYQGYLHFLARADGRLLGRVKIDPDGSLRAPLVVNGVLYDYGRGGVLAAVEPAPKGR